ncbi:MAG: YajQ family cyclic di-GMP-binding protein [Woeseiaceae bacterium]|nr:YajQ family cyclic di-GMP-binding protein [Woeseiaceae bacterium]
MPSFDVVSDFNYHEVTNAVDQSNREITTRFDFKGTNSQFLLDDNSVNLTSESEFQLQQMLDILKQKLAKRGVNVGCLKAEDPDMSINEARQKIILRKGIDSDLARKLVKHIKNSKLKVQVAIQGDQLRVSGKKRDNLQTAIQLFKDLDVELPLQYENFRD